MCEMWKIVHIKWQEHVQNTSVLKIYNIGRIEPVLEAAQLGYCGNVICMQISCGQLHGSRPGGQ